MFGNFVALPTLLDLNLQFPTPELLYNMKNFL